MYSRTKWTILRKICKNYTEFLVKKVRSGYGTIIPGPDPTRPKSSGSTKFSNWSVIKLDVRPPTLPLTDAKEQYKKKLCHTFHALIEYLSLSCVKHSMLYRKNPAYKATKDKTHRRQCKMASSKKIDMYRDFAAGVDMCEVPSPPRLLFGVV